METKDDTSRFVRMLSAPIQDELGYVDSSRTSCTTGFTVEAGLHDSLRVEIAIILVGDDFEPATRTHVFRLKHIVDWADGVALGASGAGFRQSRIVDMVREGSVADLNAGIEHSRRIEALLHPHKQIVQLRAEHRLYVFGAHPAIPVLSTDRATEAA